LPSNAGVESEPQPASGATHPTASCVFHTGDKSLWFAAYKKPSLAVAATNDPLPPGRLNNVGDEPQSKSPSESSCGSSNVDLMASVSASNRSRASL